ncbi:hypothetical protein PPROV_000593900 [Pycnococcus provasolii]|uniref:Uncharacterized protein n=1 Tax=Pycnococcus provasolii TaxID=41880 RepID=A0A830HQC6_9CHLO|nr:hypothetical protein PPROV_000593900 [Pycnococcus provasolii]
MASPVVWPQPEKMLLSLLVEEEKLLREEEEEDAARKKLTTVVLLTAALILCDDDDATAKRVLDEVRLWGGSRLGRKYSVPKWLSHWVNIEAKLATLNTANRLDEGDGSHHATFIPIRHPHPQRITGSGRLPFGYLVVWFGLGWCCSKIQEQFAAAVSKWIQEHRAGEPVSYPYASNNFRRRLTEDVKKTSASSSRRLASMPAMKRRAATADELASEEAAEISMGGGDSMPSNEWHSVHSSMERESWDSSSDGAGRHLLGKKGRPRPVVPAAAAAAAAGAGGDAGHNVAWERDCQQQLVDVGMLAVHGVHVEFPTEEAAAEAQAALQAQVVG